MPVTDPQLRIHNICHDGKNVIYVELHWLSRRELKIQVSRLPGENIVFTINQTMINIRVRHIWRTLTMDASREQKKWSGSGCCQLNAQMCSRLDQGCNWLSRNSGSRLEKESNWSEAVGQSTEGKEPMNAQEEPVRWQVVTVDAGREDRRTTASWMEGDKEAESSLKAQGARS